MTKNHFKKLPMLLSGALICTVLMLAVYMLKGVWPFGAGNVTYDDMAQGTLPIYYHLYDWLHGDKAMAFDWYTGLGTNIVNSGTFMPLDLVLCLFSRDKLLYGIGILIIVKVAASAVTAKYVFDKLFGNVNQIWRVLFSVMYAMSAYSMFYYTNSFWLDFVVIFPLVLYGLKRLLADNKPLVFILFYAYTLYLSVYIGFMVTLGVFFLSGLYILLLCEKESRGKRTCLLGISTVTGALLSAWHSVPMAIQTLSSKRLVTSFEDSKSSSPLLHILKVDTHISTLPSKLMLTIGLQLAFILAIALIVKSAKDKQYKKALLTFGTCFIFFAPVLFENINLFWHAGSYIGFTMRFFFCPVFIILLLALQYLEIYGENIYKIKSKSAKILATVLMCLLTVVFLAGILFFALKALGKLGNESTFSYIKFIGFSVLFASGIPLFSILLCQKKKITRFFCFALCTVQSLGVCYAGIANTHQKEEKKDLYNSHSFIEYCQEVSQLDLDCGELGRIKNSDTSLNTNYPFILKVPALSNWTHNIPHYMQLAATNLGYSTQYTRILDSGGTAFTDGLLGIKKLIVRNHINVSDQYKKLDNTENFVLYENSCALEIGLLGDKSLLGDITSAKAYERFDIQNKLYSSFSDSDEKLFSVCSNKGETADRIELTINEKNELVFKYTAGQNEVLYLNAADFGNKTLKIYVNGERVIAPYYKQTGYSYYPSQSVNGILTLGSFNSGETVEIAVRCINDEIITTETVQLAYMSLDKMAQLNSMYKDTVSNISVGKTSLTVKFSNTYGDGKYMFIPVTYDSGWKCTLNGEKAQVLNALGSYIAIELPEGSGTFTLNHTSPGLEIGLIMSAVGIVMAGVMLLLKKRDYDLPKIITVTVLWLFILLFAASLIFIYAVSIVFFVFYIIGILKK